MKEKGFTFIELLAVIVILSIIGLIAIPTVLNIIEKAKIGALESSAKGIEDALMYKMSLNETSNYKVENGKIISVETNEEIKIRGGNNLNGEIKIKKDGTLIYAINDGSTCVIKRDGQKEIEHIKNIKFCTMEVASNLFINGYGEYEDNTGFSGTKYENGEFIQLNQYLDGDNIIEINPNKRYYFSIDLKSNDENSSYAIGLAQSDVDNKRLSLRSMIAYQQNITELKQDLNDGNTVVYFNDLSNLNLNANDPAYKRAFAFWNYQDSTGTFVGDKYTHNIYRFSIATNGIDKLNNTITINEPWTNGFIPAGTKVSFPLDGGTINYHIRCFEKLTTNFQKYERYIEGEGTSVANFLPGTKFVALIGTSSSNYAHYKNIVLKEIEP